MRNFKILTLAFLALLFSGCAINQPKIYDYSAFLDAKPKSILVLMPTNESTEIKAASAVLSHSVLPLVEAGYYVFSPALVNETFRTNSVYEAEEIAKISLDKIRSVFAPDAVLYINITHYGTKYQILDSITQVGIYAKLIDAKTGTLLWDKTALYQQNANSGNSGGGLAGLIVMAVTAVVSQVANNLTDVAYDLSASAMGYAFSQNCYDCLLYGEKSPYFRQDWQLNLSK